MILGGARSGKSTYAEKLAAQLGQRVLYIATAEARDEEMSIRIAAHRQARRDDWYTLEAPCQVGAALVKVTFEPEGLLLDCLTLLVSNVILAMEEMPQAEVEAAVETEVEAILAVQAKFNVPLIVVSNEVGMGLVPPYPLGRLYRDVLGRANQFLAKQADQVLFMVAGLPMTVKSDGVSE